MDRYYFIEATNNETGKVQYIQAADRETAFNGLEFICVRAEARGRLYEIKETAGNVAVTVSTPDRSRSVTYFSLCPSRFGLRFGRNAASNTPL